jgi:hypothetical protein
LGKGWKEILDMTRNFIIGSTTALLLSGIASAEFINFDGVLSTNGEGNTVVQMYGVYSNSDAVALNVFNADIGTPDGFIHNDVQVAAGGTWNPTASLDIPNFSDSSNDSYVTIGYGVGAESATNSSTLDPGFGSGIGGTIPVDAGWFNGNPVNEQTASAFAGGVSGITGYAVMIGQFVFTGNIFAFEADMAANAGSGTAVNFGSGSFIIPAPGALALLGLGGLVARRRRG